MLLKMIRKKFLQLLLLLLTVGASLTLGLLSYSGMFVLWPVVSLSIAAFILAVLYEAEIFWQNIKSSFKALFSRLALKKQFLREFLVKNVPESLAEQEKLPQLLRDYLYLVNKQEDLAHKKEHDELDIEGLALLKSLKQKLKRFELEFAKQLFSLKEDDKKHSEAVKELRAWMRKNQGEAYLNKHRLRYGLFTVSKVFSILTGGFIAIGTGYLLFDVFMTLPFLAAVPAAGIPAIIITLGIFSGIAYALITYNSIISMLNNRSLAKLYNSLIKDYKTEKAASLTKKILKAFSSLIFLGLTLTLTICTAGTWWTIGQNFAFLINQAWIISGTAFITASTLIINLFNTICTWFGIKKEIKHAYKAVDEDKPKSQWQKFIDVVKLGALSYKKSWEPINKDDNSYMRYNPFRILIKIILTPIEWLMFLAHIISIGAGGNQFPGIQQYVSATLCALDEGKEDWHRFFGHKHFHGTKTINQILKARSETGGGHEHNLDLPKRFIQILLTPLYLFAIALDFIGLVKKSSPASFKDYIDLFKIACIRQYTSHNPTDTKKEDIPPLNFATTLSLPTLKFEAALLAHEANLTEVEKAINDSKSVNELTTVVGKAQGNRFFQTNIQLIIPLSPSAKAEGP